MVWHLDEGGTEINTSSYKLAIQCKPLEVSRLNKMSVASHDMLT